MQRSKNADSCNIFTKEIEERDGGTGDKAFLYGQSLRLQPGACLAGIGLYLLWEVVHLEYTRRVDIKQNDKNGGNGERIWLL